MKGYLILHVINIAGTMMIEARIYDISRGNNLGGMMRELNPLNVFPVYEGATEISPGLEVWLISWWGDNIKNMRPIDWF